MFQRYFVAGAFALALVGCSSVPLDNVPVDSKTPQAVGQQPGTAGGGGQSQVAPVVSDASGATSQGPVNVARLVYFDYDSNVIKPEYQGLIEAHARFLKANPGRRIAIEGHTDERGGREYNLALGQRRAEAVRKALALLGVQDIQMEAVSFGKEKPVATGSDEASWAQNRRAEIVYR
ncbi:MULTISPECIES: peptidoglycan-associated lipoprotein Pal [Ramlibacter]|uniref:Peptidoglycan-associated lipoprotein n=1 Tax=Ramlibacter aquaticus TaxID=2780094 RepID=A0ABR9SAE0_9BURK|nr:MULTISPECIES: peptidoglycan-associated lipoprotein Pal [Ramlibacter]MBE7939303.1 peptidoglycan-associated lipoprotein Pal [Ramlibacter aquaticus]